eukprot:GAHX01009316.1.p1 GENE.GAHX01009316.1~~GAHX01009316.1.p1  ORF type:complete len:55 (-),score=2.79 GAHX01009316.1:49-213(-)
MFLNHVYFGSKTLHYFNSKRSIAECHHLKQIIFLFILSSSNKKCESDQVNSCFY